jgi:hypothetical protein
MYEVVTNQLDLLVNEKVVRITRTQQLHLVGP